MNISLWNKGKEQCVTAAFGLIFFWREKILNTSEAFKSSLLSQQSVLSHLRFTHPFSKADTSHLSVLSRVELFCFVCVTVSSGNVFSHLRICRNLAPDSKGNNL